VRSPAFSLIAGLSPGYRWTSGLGSSRVLASSIATPRPADRNPRQPVMSPAKRPLERRSGRHRSAAGSDDRDDSYGDQEDPEQLCGTQALVEERRADHDGEHGLTRTDYNNVENVAVPHSKGEEPKGERSSHAETEHVEQPIGLPSSFCSAPGSVQSAIVPATRTAVPTAAGGEKSPARLPESIIIRIAAQPKRRAKREAHRQGGRTPRTSVRPAGRSR
jgi:hypothetical protein